MRNSRGAYRCTAPPDQQTAFLHWGRKKYRARLVNQSAGGFLVEVAPDLKLRDGEVLVLATRMGRSAVRVVRHALKPDSLELGLQRIEDLPDPDLPRAGWSWLHPVAHWQRIPRDFLYVFGLMIVAALSAILYFWPDMSGWRLNEPPPHTVRPPRSAVSWNLPWASEQPVQWGAQRSQLVRQKKRQLDLLVAPDSAAQLGLSDEQRGAIERIVTELAWVDSAGDDPSQDALDAIQQAQLDVYELLRPEQREQMRWLDPEQ